MYKYKTVQTQAQTELVYANAKLIGTIEKTWKGFEAHSVKHGYLGIFGTANQALTALQNFVYNTIKSVA